MTSAATRGRSCDVACLIEEIRRVPQRRSELVMLLDERADIYEGLSEREAERLRGYVMASFAHTGLPEDALPHVVEELATGSQPYSLAAAGRALRKADRLPEDISGLLRVAIERLQANDDFIQFDRWKAGPVDASEVTALADMLRTVAILGSRVESLQPFLAAMSAKPGFQSVGVREALSDASRILGASATRSRSCCSGATKAAEPIRLVPSSAAFDVEAVELQDQSGSLLTYAECFFGRLSVVTFFYTRCMNPEKCSLTIAKLARLQRLIRRAGMHDAVNLAAITYDPEFDGPDRLHLFGRERGFAFDERNRLLRTRGPLAPLQQHFDLGLGFGPSTLNRHRLELVVLDRDGRISESFLRVQWSEQDVLQSIRHALDGVGGNVTESDR